MLHSYDAARRATHGPLPVRIERFRRLFVRLTPGPPTSPNITTTSQHDDANGDAAESFTFYLNHHRHLKTHSLTPAPSTRNHPP